MNAQDHCTLGIRLRGQDRIEEAAAHLEQAVALRPSDPILHVNLGILYRDLGRLQESVAQYGQAIALRPDLADAHFHRAEIKTFRVGDPDLAAMEALLARPAVATRDAIQLHFALGKARDDAGDYARAFAHWAEGNRRKRREVAYDERASLAALRAAAMDRPTLRRLRGFGHPTLQLIFVVGLPRSGSTLIEQILASHPQVHAAGEIGHLAAVAGAVPDPARLDGATLQRLAEEYLGRLPPLPPGKTRLVDKAPTNFLRAGLIHLMFPHARIVHSGRDPRDTGLSCFSKLFVSGCHYSYDLAELGRYSTCYLSLMDHWRAVLPTASLIDLRYEDLVADLPRRARALIEACGLPWDEACLRFHETRRSVRTASAVQVRRTLYQTSVGRWRRFEAELAPLVSELPGGRRADLPSAS